MLNYSKNRKWKNNSTSKHFYSDMYFVYKLSKQERGAYLNTWFDGEQAFSKEGYTYTDETITLKKVDEETSRHLYHKEYNPISIRIMCPTGAKFQFVDGQPLYFMKCQIHSIDDSSYGIWFESMTLDMLKEIRTKIMEWVNLYSSINGEKFLDMCVVLGANSESKDYN